MLIDDNREYFMLLINNLIEKVKIKEGIWCKNVCKKNVWFLYDIIFKYILWFELGVIEVKYLYWLVFRLMDY